MNDHDTARERREEIAEAIYDAVGGGGVPYRRVGPLSAPQDQADAVIAHLWGRAESSEVVAAFATEFMCADHGGVVGPATPIHFLLTALLGPRPKGDTDEQ